MSTPRVGRAAFSSKPASVQKTAAAPKVSFAEMLASKQTKKKPAPAAPSSEVMDEAARSLLTATLGISKERKLDQDKAEGGLDGED